MDIVFCNEQEAEALCQVRADSGRTAGAGAAQHSMMHMRRWCTATCGQGRGHSCSARVQPSSHLVCFKPHRCCIRVCCPAGRRAAAASWLH